MMFRAKRIFFATFLVAFCAVAPALAQERAQPQVKVNFKSLSVERINWLNQTADLTVSVEVENPGPSLKLKDLRYNLKLNGESAATGERKEEIKLAANSSTDIALPVTVNLLSLPGVTYSTLYNGLNLRYEFETEFTVPILLMINHKVKTSFTGDLPIGDMIVSAPGKIKDRLTGKP